MAAPSFLYGVEVSGVADAMQQQGRSVAARAAAPAGGGKNPDIVLYILDGAAGAMDPAFDAHVLPVKHWALAWWEHWFAHEFLDLVYRAACARLGEGHWSWHRVAGPASALLMSLRRIGWEMLSAMEVVDDVGQCWHFVMDSPAAIAAACRQSVRRWRLARLTAALPHLAPDACDVAGRPDVDTVLLDLGVEASKLVSSRAKRAVVEGFIWDPKWRGDLASACCGGQWPQARRAKLVRGEFDIRCQLCFEAPGTLSHRFVCRVTRPNAGWPGPPPGADLLRNQMSEERARTLDARGCWSSGCLRQHRL